MNILPIKNEPQLAGFINKCMEEQFKKVALASDGNMGCKQALENDFEWVTRGVTLYKLV